MSKDLMYELIEAFPEQINNAIKLSESFETTSVFSPSAILITGMGGSGISGRIASQILAPTLNVPVLCVNDYALPAWCNHTTLVIVCSYSGNTEETISVMQQALLADCNVSCICTGGKVAELAHTHKLACITIPGGQPPRSQFAMAFVQVFRILELNGLISKSYTDDFNQAAKLLIADKSAIQAATESIAEKIFNTVPLIYADSMLEGVAARWRQQFNENSKMLCIHHAIPEMNHNELVGWGGADERFAAIILHTENDHPKTKKRMEISRAIMQERTPLVFNVEAKGNSIIERCMYLIHFGDWLSWHLEVKRGYDPIAIPEIDLLKSEMAKS
jgi:glucose/mannose-6-phosphate isomerase